MINKDIDIGEGEKEGVVFNSSLPEFFSQHIEQTYLLITLQHPINLVISETSCNLDHRRHNLHLQDLSFTG